LYSKTSRNENEFIYDLEIVNIPAAEAGVAKEENLGMLTVDVLEQGLNYFSNGVEIQPGYYRELSNGRFSLSDEVDKELANRLFYGTLKNSLNIPEGPRLVLIYSLNAKREDSILKDVLQNYIARHPEAAILFIDLVFNDLAIIPEIVIKTFVIVKELEGVIKIPAESKIRGFIVRV
jgi:hypothetical protein